MSSVGRLGGDLVNVNFGSLGYKIQTSKTRMTGIYMYSCNFT